MGRSVERREWLVDRLNFESVVYRELVGDLTAEQWKTAVAYFDGRCAYCGEQQKITVDHFIPQSLGGGTTVFNVIPACRSCNKRKSSRELSACSFVPEQRKAKVYAYLEFVRSQQGEGSYVRIG